MSQRERKERKRKTLVIDNNIVEMGTRDEKEQHVYDFKMTEIQLRPGKDCTKEEEKKMLVKLIDEHLGSDEYVLNILILGDAKKRYQSNCSAIVYLRENLEDSFVASKAAELNNIAGYSAKLK